VSLDVKEKTWAWAYQGADGAGLPLQEEAGEVEHKDHHMVVQQRGVHLHNVKKKLKPNLSAFLQTPTVCLK
jgi:hypothetical protein